MAAQLPHQDRRGPRCRNSWRPSDGPLLPQDERVPQRRNVVAVPSDGTAKSCTEAPARSRHLTAWGMAGYDHRTEVSTTLPQTPELSTSVFQNPNLMPVVPRRSETSPSGSSELEQPLPQVWHPSLDDFIRRTANAYDLVMNYERDAEGGQRWLPKDVTKIRKVGKNLHSGIFALRRLQQKVADQGDKDQYFMMKIKREANNLKLLCERIQQAVSKYEQKCELELLRDGAYVQDEDGNFYKPTTPHRYMAEGGVLQSASSLNTGHEEHARLNRHYGYVKYHSEEYHNVAQRPRNPSEDHTTLAPHPPSQRNLSWDDRSSAMSYGSNTARASHPGDENWRPPLPRLLDTVPDSEINLTIPVHASRPASLPNRNASSGGRSHSTQGTSDAKPRRLFATLVERNGKSRKQVMREEAWKRERERGRERSASPVRSKPYNTEESREHQRQRSRSPLLSKAYTTRNEREGKSRRERKREEERGRSPRPVAGRLGKHVLHL